MIQRVQTVFMILSCLFMTLFLFVPSFTIMSAEGMNKGVFVAHKSMSFLILGTLIVLTGIGNIFLFNNRALQLKIEWGRVLLTLVLIGLLVSQYFQLSTDSSVKAEIAFGGILPVVSIIFSFLAINGIRKDDKLIKSLDRLR